MHSWPDHSRSGQGYAEQTVIVRSRVWAGGDIIGAVSINGGSVLSNIPSVAHMVLVSRL